MKTFFSEFRVDYTTYTFGYTAYCLQESGDSFQKIYALGFLPFTGEQRIKEPIYYMARSLRIDLATFSDSSENRRIHRKVTDLNLSFSVIKKADFDLSSSSFQKTCLDYAAVRFVGNEMSKKRFDYILSRSTLTHIFEYKKGDETFGYILTCLEEKMIHYWFAFFDVEMMASHSIGKWMMWSVIDWAKKQNMNYVYLGTAYNKKSLYKIRDFKGAEYFDGSGWNKDMAQLKVLCKTDDLDRKIDRFKEQESFADLLLKTP